MIYNLSSICGQVQLKQQLINLWRNQAHAVLITGEIGSGRKLAGRVLASAYLCQKIGDVGSCGECKACRLFAEGNHPDYREVLSDDGKRIKIKRLREEVIAELVVKPQMTDCKVYLIDLAHIDEAAQNVLLKSLEEPPAFVRFILIVDHLRQVLPTVISRCKVLRTSPLSSVEMDEALHRYLADPISREQANFLYQYAGGNVGRALDIYRDDVFMSLRAAACSWFGKLASASKSELLIDGYKFFADERNNLDVILNIWQSMWRDLALVKADQVRLVINQDQVPLLQAMLADKDIDENALTNILNKEFQVLKDLRRQLQVNVTYEHAISSFLLQSQRLVQNRK